MSVSDTEILSIELPCNEHAPGTVRDALDESTQADWVLGDAMLIANELVTNAVQHSGCSGDHVLHVDVTRQPQRLVIRVRDPGLSDTEAGGHRPGADGGWGLVIVDELAQRWGAERAEGYSVWAEIALPA